MKELEYPFDAAYIIKKRKSLKKALQMYYDVDPL